MGETDGRIPCVGLQAKARLSSGPMDGTPPHCGSAAYPPCSESGGGEDRGSREVRTVERRWSGCGANGEFGRGGLGGGVLSQPGKILRPERRGWGVGDQRELGVLPCY